MCENCNKMLKSSKLIAPEKGIDYKFYNMGSNCNISYSNCIHS